jgi:hypothetical protein
MIPLALGGSTHVIIGPHDDLVTRSNNDFGTLPITATLALRGGGTDISLGALGTYAFLFAHYGGPGGGTIEAWFVGNLSGDNTIPQTGFGHRLSGWALFTAGTSGVSDSGSAVALLGIGLGVIEFIRHKLRLR